MSEEVNKKSVGQLGEDLTANHLAAKGWQILERNVREKFGEIDILAKTADGRLHFVEVKTISKGYADYSGMAPEDNLSRSKLMKMKKIAEWYANRHPELFGSGGWQIDLVAVSLPDDKAGEGEVKLYSNIA